MTLKTRIFKHNPCVSLARFTFCWWRHNRLAMTSQWPDNCDANTWQVISNSLDIDFIHGDIHGRSCKKERNFEATLWCHRWRHHHKKPFFCHNLGQSFHIWGQIEAVFNISEFSKWPPFWARQTFLPEVIPEVEYTRKTAMSFSNILSFWSTL